MPQSVTQHLCDTPLSPLVRSFCPH